MENFTNNATEILLLIFLTITFLQSGIDKIIDWRGNLSWLNGHFAKTAFKGSVAILLGIVLFMEMVSGILAAVAIFQFVFEGESSIGFHAAVVSSITLLLLFFGQRMAKDYEGAKTIVVYLIPTVFLVYLLQ